MSNEVNNSIPKTKDVYWQYVRGICIICVILIHCKSGIEYEHGLDSSWNFDYWFLMRQLINFPVAIFILLSGYFTKIEATTKLNISYIAKRVSRLLIPFIVWSTFYTLINVVKANNNLDIVKTIGKLLLGLSQGHLYYILVLLQLTIITPILIKVIKAGRKSKLLFIITPVYLVFLYLYVVVLKNQLPFYQTLFPAWFIFYYLGLSIKIKGYKPIFKRNQIRSSILLFFVAFLFSVVEGYRLLSLGFSIEFASSQIKLSSFIYVFALINLLIVIKPNMEKLKTRQLKFIGDNSYGIYYVHMFWVMISNKILSQFTILEEVLPFYQLSQVTFVLILSCISIIVTKKIMGKQLSSKIFGF